MRRSTRESALLQPRHVPAPWRGAPRRWPHLLAAPQPHVAFGLCGGSGRHAGAREGRTDAEQRQRLFACTNSVNPAPSRL